MKITRQDKSFRPKLARFLGQPRKTLLLLLGWLHCGLLAGMLSAMIFDVLLSMAHMDEISPEAAFLRGILFAVPTGLCYWGVKRLPALWQFLLLGAALCGLSWLLMGQPVGAALMVFMVIIRTRTRLAEAEEGPITSLFDAPAYFGLALFATAFLLSAGVGLPRLQRLSVLGAVLYLLVCLASRSLGRLDNYLALNQGMRDLPARRIQRIAGSGMLACLLLTAALLLPLALSSSGTVRIHLPDNTRRGTPVVEFETNSGGGAQPMDMDLGELMDAPTWQIPPIVTNILLALIGGAMLVGLVFALKRLFADFRLSYTDSRDVVQYLSRRETDSYERADPPRPRIWDRSVNAAVRRKYQKTLRKAGQPEAWMTPEEAEAATGLNLPELHRVYEKARYGPEGASQEDLRALK